jgi:hypothetical protein
LIGPDRADNQVCEIADSAGEPFRTDTETRLAE